VLSSCLESACATTDHRPTGASSPHGWLGVAVGTARPGFWLIVCLVLLVLFLYLIAPVIVVLRRRSVDGIRPEQLTIIYGEALVDVLGVQQDDARLLPHVLEAIEREQRRPPLDGTEVRTSIGVTSYAREFKEATRLVSLWRAIATADEWWDGSGPTGAPPSRLAGIVAVADAWAKLTASSGAALSHEEAIYELRAWAGTRYDPQVIEAAAQVVRRERRTTRLPAFCPQAHRLRRLVGQPRFYLKMCVMGAWALLDVAPPPRAPGNRGRAHTRGTHGKLSTTLTATRR
jgi:hypothetical protein